jgi:ABC-type amino acid transport substrate-binding protein
MEFEKSINERLKRNTITVQVIVIPTRRDRLLPGLVDGRGDIAAGNLTITPERLKLIVDFFKEN